ncbi:efflux RND transporter periplasmic adaptor subunit [Desulfosarcina sp.]|uniref:efflux RND transporter periplasmic adaptor subunit n=1 Tax=Desulfosarcina sp. TaxID=2027861 RepID=UPI0029AAB0A9|nr:efflux RND transporter periplasmic adaptor subunit [Desulfosarcina sp.]MDX2451630.1 efflux RND transporter periplasmic adaptor subunit [Desulfosarcina sp.]MDX2489419.1 efflux RND transporter periplasmic adaptor subunit [Desulfosarcina sp.]
MITRYRSFVFSAVLIGLMTGMPVLSRAETLQGITAPNADITLSFVVAGRVSDVQVEPGTTVEKDQLLVHLYDEPEKIQCKQLKMLSEDRTKINAAKAELAQKQVDLKKLEQARAKGAASVWEVEHLFLNVRIAELSLQSAILEQQQYRQRYDHASSQLVRMRLAAPIAGLVEEVNVEVGESIGTLGPVIRIVQNDPLWIDVPVPMAQALNLTVDQDVWITFPGATDEATPNGRIINISAVADAASETLRIRIEVPNPLKRPAGERVAVAFTKTEDDNTMAQLDSQ